MVARVNITLATKSDNGISLQNCINVAHHVIFNILECIKRLPITKRLSKPGAEHIQLFNGGCHGENCRSNHMTYMDFNLQIVLTALNYVFCSLLESINR